MGLPQPFVSFNKSQIQNRNIYSKFILYLQTHLFSKLALGLEPRTSTLPRWRSTTELCQRLTRISAAPQARTGSVGAESINVAFAMSIKGINRAQKSHIRAPYGGQ